MSQFYLLFSLFPFPISLHVFLPLPSKVSLSFLITLVAISNQHSSASLLYRALPYMLLLLGIPVAGLKVVHIHREPRVTEQAFFTSVMKISQETRWVAMTFAEFCILALFVVTLKKPSQSSYPPRSWVKWRLQHIGSL